MKNIFVTLVLIGQTCFVLANPALPVNSRDYHEAMGNVLLGYFEDYVVFSLESSDVKRAKMLIDDFSVYSFQYFYRVRYEAMKRSQQWERGVWRTSSKVRETKLAQYFIGKIRDPLDGTGMEYGEGSRFPKIGSEAEYMTAIADFEGFIRGFEDFLKMGNETD